jgi:EAL domain-containing protein (putative c-di-GMP-specific phosphodiesterase class I)
MAFALPASRLRRTRQTLREERNLLDVLLNSVDVAVVACRADGQLTHINRRSVELMGLDGSTGSDPDTWIEQVWPRTPEGERMTLDDLPIVRALQGEVVRGVDLLVQTSRGEVLMNTSANPVYNDEGTQVGAVAVFADVTEQRAREAEIRRELQDAGLVVEAEDAIKSGRLLMYAQPIIDLATGETVLEELLLRVRSRDGTIVGPAALLTAAERQGMVTAVDEWVFAQAARAGAEGHAVTVNISARTVGQSAFLSVVEHTLERDGIEPSLITFEITETAVVSDIVGATRFASRLEAIGCHFALDDFGTGYAALTYLKHLPIRYLKIDIDFVRDLVENERSRAVVSGVVALAAGFGQLTIAEGVENAATLALLRELGVDMAQGFHLGRPAPIAAAEAAGPSGCPTAPLASARLPGRGER